MQKLVWQKLRHYLWRAGVNRRAAWWPRVQLPRLDKLRVAALGGDSKTTIRARSCKNLLPHHIARPSRIGKDSAASSLLHIGLNTGG